MALFRKWPGLILPDPEAQTDTVVRALFFRLPRVYPIIDTGTLERLGLNPVDAAEALLEGGAGILQFRHKSFWSREIFEQAKQIARLCQEANALFIVNDRADYALLLGAGLHLGQEDLLPQDARTVVGTTPVIGFSTHDAAQLEDAKTNPIDYAAFGPIYSTTTKEHPSPTTGIEGLRQMRMLTELPLVAIGGITRRNAPDCWKAGADSVAVIADIFPNPCTKPVVRERMTEWRELSRGTILKS
jgi:thiamine-phosphate pyrophosphorylase